MPHATLVLVLLLFLVTVWCGFSLPQLTPNPNNPTAHHRDRRAGAEDSAPGAGADADDLARGSESPWQIALEEEESTRSFAPGKLSS